MDASIVYMEVGEFSYNVLVSTFVQQSFCNISTLSNRIEIDIATFSFLEENQFNLKLFQFHKGVNLFKFSTGGGKN